jgi:hypothetical protein
MLAGFALRKQDPRLANILAELLNENTTFEEMMMVMQAIFPEEMKGLVNRKPAATLIQDRDSKTGYRLRLITRPATMPRRCLASQKGM